MNVIKRVAIFTFVLVVIVALNRFLLVLGNFLPWFLVPFFTIAVNLFIVGSVMFYLFKD